MHRQRRPERTVETRGVVKGRLAVLAAAVAVFASGSAGVGAIEVDPQALPGVYRNGETGGKIHLHDNGRFSVTGIEGRDLWWHGGAEVFAFGGAWTAAGPEANFVYLNSEDTSGGQDRGDIQLYTASTTKVFLQPDPDRPVTLTLVKGTSP
ncbi:hypothetical protein [Streptomyces sp. NPDC049813]|uniref:hypothetical protein n=1 Tax=Streptomyces sp. NPDC049813 TaxID=3365597 RepID=UPI0037A05564